ncbi:Uncharacterised protein [Salmonella enterica subsp. enterica serovar Bovismorbificans]|nr:Uncharacterised protein [Salmonella enterica subsp. enterica serovar Bovismorbificans]CPR78826.1 Uncharacterised protein [Salmonella enterica subsp. enterica serovar Bovismorbificans]
MTYLRVFSENRPSAGRAEILLYMAEFLVNHTN